jgi:hypothetical protein
MPHIINSLKITLIILGISLIQTVKADEGMWQLYNLSACNYQKMQSLGLQIRKDSLYNTSNPSLKDAVVSLNNGSCTGSFISNEGLVITNNHCVLDDVQKHSSVTSNYLENGFWAIDKSSELPNMGGTATILIDALDVTQDILTKIPVDADELRRTFLIDSISNEIVIQHESNSNYLLEVNPFYEGNQFVLLISQVFEDVRLVASPPSTIAQFGRDEDNWMWPRHSADFALLRVYTGPDGKPAPYSENNIPYKPKKVLAIHTGGISNGDFSMVMGYPGSTQRYISSYGIEEIEKIINPVVIDVRGQKQSIWENGMESNSALKIQYASKYAESSNYWKYAIGQNLAIQKKNMVANRKMRELRFQKWLAENPERLNEYGYILPSLGVIYAFKTSSVKNSIVTMETLATGPDLFLLSLEALYFKSRLESAENNSELIDEAKAEFQESTDEMFKGFNSEIDKKVFVAMLEYYRKNLPDSLRATDKEIFIHKNRKSNSSLADYIYQNSILTNNERFTKFMANPNVKTLKNDPALLFVETIMNQYGESYFVMEEIESQIDVLMRHYTKGLLEMDSIQESYPDANSTLRLTYGTVQSYAPQDGVIYKHFTTTNGLLQKVATAPSIYQLPDSFKTILTTNDFGNYHQPDGQMPVCFITNNDITGGNSGSPVLNGRGELVGLAFDGNWEGMGSDLEYMPHSQMCVNVDIRYILFVIDKYAGAQWLLDEIGIERN